jgi:hypothetical protein
MSALTIERIQQEKDHLQKAQFIDEYRKSHSLSIKTLSDALKMQPSYVCHYLRLLKLPSIVIDGYYGKMVSATHLYIIARLKTQVQMQEAYEEVLAKSLSSQQTEALIREKLYGIASNTERLSKSEIDAYIKNISEQYPELKITVVQTRIKGKILFEIKGDTSISTSLISHILNRLIISAQEQKKNAKRIITLE